MATSGHEADPVEVETLLASLISEDDRRNPMTLYTRASQVQTLAQELERQAANLRCHAVAEIYQDKGSLAAVAETLGVTRSMVHKMVRQARDPEYRTRIRRMDWERTKRAVRVAREIEEEQRRKAAARRRRRRVN